MSDQDIEMDITARMHGFESWSELTKIISSINLVKNGNLRKFQTWQEYDGTKEGLIKAGLLENQVQSQNER